MDSIEYGFDTLATLTGGAIIHRGIYEDPDREKLVAYTIVGGLKSPRKRIEQLKKFLCFSFCSNRFISLGRVIAFYPVPSFLQSHIKLKLTQSL